jgi:N-hydroxyarylamine O-acetyltransferase
MTTSLFDAYLDRLRVTREAPSVEALFRLHRAHIERIPYDTTWIHLGERWGVNQQASVEHIALHGRGGYCFHLNGALAALLTDLGYRVEMHVGGVHRDVPIADALTNHLVLTVHDLPSDDNPSGIWYVDTGLGDALYEPMPLMPGRYRQGPREFELSATPGGVGDWHLAHDPTGSFVGMAFRAEPASLADFETRHVFLSTSPESSFVRTVSLQRRDASTLSILRALTLTTVTAEGTTSVVVDDRAEWYALLASTFDLDLRTADRVARDRLFDGALESHCAHLAALNERGEQS